jgi:hypothetical protein
MAPHRAVHRRTIDVIAVSRMQEQSAEWLRNVAGRVGKRGMRVRGDEHHRRSILLKLSAFSAVKVYLVAPGCSPPGRGE